MHLKNERYFVIGGFITNELHKVRSIHKNIEKIIKMRLHIDINKSVEFKSSHMNINDQVLFLNEIYNLKKVLPVVIVVDKNSLDRFKASENIAYNYFIKSLINYLFHCNITLLNTHDIELRVDNRSISVNKLKELESFLNWQFKEKCISFKVNYLDSKYYREIQMADYIANMFWKKYNSKKKKNIVKKIKYVNKTYISKFPFKY